jgi:hypothetical protein
MQQSDAKLGVQTTQIYSAKSSQKEYMKVRYMGDVPITYIGKATGKNYGLRNPRTNFYVLKEDGLHPESGLVLFER